MIKEVFYKNTPEKVRYSANLTFQASENNGPETISLSGEGNLNKIRTRFLRMQNTVRDGGAIKKAREEEYLLEVNFYHPKDNKVVGNMTCRTSGRKNRIKQYLKDMEDGKLPVI